MLRTGTQHKTKAIIDNTSPAVALPFFLATATLFAKGCGWGCGLGWYWYWGCGCVWAKFCCGGSGGTGAAGGAIKPFNSGKVLAATHVSKPSRQTKTSGRKFSVRIFSNE